MAPLKARAEQEQLEHASDKIALTVLAKPRGEVLRRVHQQMAPARHAPLDKGAGSSDQLLGSHWKEAPKPFVWHKTANEILQSLAAYLSVLP